MAIGDSYLSVSEFKARTGSSSSAKDSAIAAVLASASRQIDGHCGQSFNLSDAMAKFFTLRYPEAIEVPPLASVTELATDDGTRTYQTIWATTDYDLYPFDADDLNEPFTEIRRSPNGQFSWPSTVKGIRITGAWGWPSVPSPVVEACFLIANRQKSLWDAPFGLSGGSNEMGALDMTQSMTPIIAAMLKPFVVRAL